VIIPIQTKGDRRKCTNRCAGTLSPQPS